MRRLLALLLATAEGVFFNPWGEQRPSLVDFLRWRFSRNIFDKSAAPVVPVVANDGASLAEPNAPAELTWVGHATFAIHGGDDVVLTDPHFGARALLPKRHTPPGIPLESVPAHVRGDLAQSLRPSRRGDRRWYVPLGLGAFFRERGRADVTERDWWRSAKRGRWTITCLPSQHWSLRFGEGRNTNLWCAWLIDSGAHRYFFAGDTGYFGGAAELGRELAPIAMNPEEALQSYRDLGARYMLGMHWGTFERWRLPEED